MSPEELILLLVAIKGKCRPPGELLLKSPENNGVGVAMAEGILCRIKARLASPHYCSLWTIGEGKEASLLFCEYLFSVIENKA